MTPDERRQQIALYGDAYRLLTAALDGFPRAMWQFRPAPDRWTIHEIIVHIADSEANSYIRCRKFIAEPGSTVRALPNSLAGGRLAGTATDRSRVRDALASRGLNPLIIGAFASPPEEERRAEA